MLVTMGSVQLEEFYPAVAVSALMRIVRDPSLSSHHTMVIQVCINIRYSPAGRSVLGKVVLEVLSMVSGRSLEVQFFPIQCMY